MLSRVENSINSIRDIGRENYKKYYKKGGIDSDLQFRIIEHDNITTDKEHGFEKWRKELDELTAL
jgi:hypothetical protein